MKTYTVKINEYATQNNHKLPETCGHKHRTERTADKCRQRLAGNLRIGWTDAIIVENI